MSDEELQGEAVGSVASIFGGLRQMVEPWRAETEALKKRIAELEKRIEAMEESAENTRYDNPNAQ
jgi:hypothetical protein